MVRGGLSAGATCALGEFCVLGEGEMIHVFLVSVSMSSSSRGGCSVVVLGFAASGTCS